MRKSLWILTALLVVGLPAMVWAQEEQDEEPPVVRLSFFMCDLGGGNGERIEQELESQVIPVWKELVAEGRGVLDYGYIFHWWADEWNVGIYTIAESIQAILDAEEEADNRLTQRYGEDPTAFGQACPYHRDGFYTLGPNTGTDEEAGAGR
ncbi:MAG: hypothetical protein ACREK5_02360 [Gemmatimonadota bacterium]